MRDEWKYSTILFLLYSCSKGIIYSLMLTQKAFVYQHYRREHA